MTQLPILQALVLADHVYTDRESGKNIVAGTFNTLHGSSFPTTYQRGAFMFGSITEIREPIELTLKYIQNKDLKVLFESNPIRIETQDPFATIELVIELPPIPMPHIGTFSFELHVNDHRLGAVRVITQERKVTQ